MHNNQLVGVFGLKDGIFNTHKCVGTITSICIRPDMEGSMLGRGGEGRGGEGRGGEKRFVMIADTLHT